MAISDEEYLERKNRILSYGCDVSDEEKEEMIDQLNDDYEEDYTSGEYVWNGF